jgi:hypothetical protein
MHTTVPELMFEHQACATLPAMHAIDHAIVAVTDPESWAARLRDLSGLDAVPGGRHEGHGTGNWIVPLGESYLELMTVVDRPEAEQSELGRWVLDQTRNGDRLVAVCIRTDDIEEVASRTGLAVQPMSRRTADDGLLSWRLVGLEAAMSDERLPFFIQWDVDDGQHPGRMHADHAIDPQDICWVEYGGDSERLGDWLGDHSLPVRCVDEQSGPRTVAIRTNKRIVRVTTAGIA